MHHHINQPRKRVDVVEMGKKCVQKKKWVKQGEHPKMPHPQCIKTYYQTTIMPKVPQSMGFYYGQTPK